MASYNVSSLLSSISFVGSSFAQQTPGSREELVALAYKLAAALETPNEFIQRTGWAEVQHRCLIPALAPKLLISTFDSPRNVLLYKWR